MGEASSHEHSNQRVGAAGERVAARYLVRAGWSLLDCNWRHHATELRGELDIVARDGEVIVFCEVKTRRGQNFGHPAEAVVAAKASRIRSLGMAWLQQSGLRPEHVRFDVISVWLPRTGTAHLEHIRAAF